MVQEKTLILYLSLTNVNIKQFLETKLMPKKNDHNIKQCNSFEIETILVGKNY